MADHSVEESDGEIDSNDFPSTTISQHVDFYEHGDPDAVIDSEIMSKYIPMHERVGLVYDVRMEEHRSSSGYHPEQPSRVRAIFCTLEERGLAQRCVRIPSREATPDELLSVHDADYVQTMCSLHKLSTSELRRMSSGMDSIYLCPGTSSAALLAVGSVLEATERVCRGLLRRAVCVVRPPGAQKLPSAHLLVMKGDAVHSRTQYPAEAAIPPRPLLSSPPPAPHLFPARPGATLADRLAPNARIAAGRAGRPASACIPGGTFISGPAVRRPARIPAQPSNPCGRARPRLPPSAPPALRST